MKQWQLHRKPWAEQTAPACRVIIDNDFAGDPDDLYQLVHHLLSDTVDIRFIICSHLRAGDFINPSGDTVAHAETRVRTLLGHMGCDAGDIIVRGSEQPLQPADPTGHAAHPQPSPACDAIIREAMRDDTDVPLYYVAGGGVTDLISAYLTEPRIADRMRVVWIGGQEYPGVRPPLNRVCTEYNADIDPLAARMLLCDTPFELWQVPRNAYRQCLVSIAELRERVLPCGEIGRFLYDSMNAIRTRGDRYGTKATGAYCLGDSPLVSLTALLTPWEVAPASHHWHTVSAVRLDEHDRPIAVDEWPDVGDDGHAGPDERAGRRAIHIVDQVDTRLLFEDLFAQLRAFHRWQEA